MFSHNSFQFIHVLICFIEHIYNYSIKSFIWNSLLGIIALGPLSWFSCNLWFCYCHWDLNIKNQIIGWFFCVCFGRFFCCYLFILPSFFLVEVLAMFEGEVGIWLCSVKAEVSFSPISLVIIALGSIPEAPCE